MTQEPLQQPDCPACLFIGGPADGQRIAVPDSMHLVEWPDGCGQSFTYRKELLGAPDETWRVFIHDPVTLTAAMEMLVQGYTPKKP